MAKYTITHNCGHEQTYELFGPVRNCNIMSCWLVTQPCSECRGKTQKEDNSKTEHENIKRNYSKGKIKTIL